MSELQGWLLLFSCQIVSDSLQPYGLQWQASLSLTISQSLPKFMSIESVMPSNHLILCCPLLLLPSIYPGIRVFSIEMKQPWVYMCSPSRSPFPPPSLPAPSRSSQCTRSKRLSHASNLGWWSVSPKIIYIFQCCSLEPSHPRLSHRV